MDKQTARAHLKRLLQPFRDKTYADLELLVGFDVAQETIVQPDGTQFDCTVKVIWADWPAGHITVYGVAGKFPRTVAEAFIMSPERRITAEETR